MKNKFKVMKIRILIGNLLYKIGFKPSIEAFGDGAHEVIGGGFFRIKDRIIYTDGLKAYIFPVTILPDFLNDQL